MTLDTVRKRVSLFGRVIALMAVLSLCLSQLIVDITHSPTTPVEATSAAVDHPVHTDRDAHDPASGHDATDHEHQVNALTARLHGDTFPAVHTLSGQGPLDLESVICEGPRRPPRTI